MNLHSFWTDGLSDPSSTADLSLFLLDMLSDYPGTDFPTFDKHGGFRKASRTVALLVHDIYELLDHLERVMKRTVDTYNGEVDEGPEYIYAITSGAIEAELLKQIPAETVRVDLPETQPGTMSITVRFHHLFVKGSPS